MEPGAIRKGELRDNLERLMVQKPNSSWLGISFFPLYKVWLYNLRYEKLRHYTGDSVLPKTTEKPVEFDSLLVRKSSDYMKSYLFNVGYFHPQVSDTFYYKGRKAYAEYSVKTGPHLTIGKIRLNIDDSAIHKIVAGYMGDSHLQEGAPFTMSLLEQERSRIANLVREFGYYRFSQENIVDFSIDTFSTAFMANPADPFESAAAFEQEKAANQNKGDITIVIRKENPDAYSKFLINRVTVYPDFVSRADATDTTMIQSKLGDVIFRYHKKYIKEQVILKHIYLEQGKVYSQSDYDATINKLNQLGVFQTVRIFMNEDTTYRDSASRRLNVFVLLTPASKYDLTANLEVSTGTTYFLGVTPTVSLRDRNLGKGANLFTASVSGGIETFYDQERGENFFDHINVLTKNFGFNTTLDFPKFLVPFKLNTTKKNLPRTVIGFGSSFLDRTNFFTLTNTAANLTYRWRETSTKNWELSPAFINIIKRPATSADFQARLDSNLFLANSYRENFIQGESIGFTFSNQFDNKGKSYSYLRLAVEEAGGIMSLLDNFQISNLQYAQYFKVDFDARRYINRAKSQVAVRFYGGSGFPYGNSPTLPYIKQYFVGGAYSIRGWRIRSLGPGSYYDPKSFTDSVAENSSIYIDRTGDIKLEMNGEYRFDIIQFFSGTIKMTGALFADAGNIWLANRSSNYPSGEFEFKKLGNDIAISTGAGARFNLAGFFIFRIDAAFPVKKPYNPQYDYGGWVLREIDFGNKTW
ncbi:MAG: hypothetical protein EOP49_17785, partial [Sphingobacteriales bacterium]